MLIAQLVRIFLGQNIFISNLFSEAWHYATNRQVAGSIPDEVIGFFNWPNPSSRTTALGSNQPLTIINIRNIPGGQRAAGA
jgi:hypothetical protein